MIYVSLGSNLGNRLENIRAAVELLRREIFTELRCLPILETEAITPDGAPDEWRKAFLNTIVYGESALAPLDLLRVLKEIEVKLGRPTDRKKWEPRVIDLDILLYNDLVLETPELTVPHPELCNRPFLVQLLALINPCLRYPRDKVSQSASSQRRLGSSTIPSESWELDSTRRAGSSGQARRKGLDPSLRWDDADGGDRSLYHPDARSFGEIARGFPDINESFQRAMVLATKLVGVVNVTPDSFSDGGVYFDTAKAIARALCLVKDGATMVELGAQSTRPGAAIISAEEEYSRLAPVLDGLLEEMKSGVIRISLDSFYPEVINKVLQHYPIVCVNDVKGELDGETLMAIAAKNCKLVVMHSLSVPAKKGEHLPDDEPAITQINDWIDRTLQRLLACGFREELVIFDPGIGFGKSAYQSLDLIRCAEQIKSKGCEVMFGHSRKSCIAAFSKASAIERDLETIAMSNYLSSCGIDYLRVHNVKDHQRFFVAKQFIYNPSLRAQRGNLSVSTDRLPRRYAPRNDGVGRAEAKIIGIMACAHDGVVGNKGAIPWRYPEEFRHFRETIGDCPIIVGRKTFDGLPDSILKNRVSIVFSRAKKFKTRGAIVVSSLDEFFALDILAKTDKVFLIGGAELANFFLEQELVSEFILTKVKGSYVGDAFLNLRAFDNWASAVISEGPDYSIYKLTRVI